MASMFPERGVWKGIPNWWADIDLERLKAKALRLYLWRSLQCLDAQIIGAYEECERMMAEGTRRSCWTAAEESQLWGELFELDYLESSREAITEVLQRL